MLVPLFISTLGRLVRFRVRFRVEQKNKSFLYPNMEVEQIKEESVGPYCELVTALRRVKQPLADILATHDQFVLQNISIMNDVKSLKTVRRLAERAKEAEHATQQNPQPTFSA